MQRVILYVDGYNLYFGLKNAHFKRYFWLDIKKLGKALLFGGQELVAARYFTSRIRDNGKNGEDRKRQNTYLEALEVQGVQCQFGHYLEKERICHTCKATWPDYEEKMTDVNIACQLLLDAFDDAFDVALVLSGDSDLSTPIRRTLERFPDKRVISVFPPRRQSKELKSCASGYVYLGEDKLRSSQLPEQLTKPDGYVLRRPVSWK
jgi:uncharacterized LabA/DUF88 family protein